MKVSEAIKKLEALDPESDIIAAWWEASMFGEQQSEDWERFCNMVEAKYDWSETHDAINDILHI